MKRLLPILFVAAFGLALLGAAPPPSPETLVEQGNKALADGEFTQAIELYEQAEPRAADPGLITMNLALAKYGRGLKDNSANDLGEAAKLFGCLLDNADPRRPAALLGLGNCLLQQAGTRDARSVENATEQYEECLRAATDDTLRADAQHNLERARLLLHQIRKAEEEQPKPDDPNRGPDPNPKPPKPPQTQQNPMSDPNNHGPRQNPRAPGDPVPVEKGDHPIKTDDPPAPGKGNLRPVPDQPDQPPLSAEEAKEHLKLANERIWRERHQHRLGLAKPPAEGVRDW
jgi:tetratricopeptide (TPR) repeat protein